VIIIKVDIVGGSLSGLSAAITLKEQDKLINVIVHEKHKNIGYNHEGRRCGEAHSIEKDWNKWIPKRKSYFNEIRKAEVYVGDKKYEYYRKPATAYMLNRQEFICQLCRQAEELGAVIKTNDKIKNINNLDGDYIIDASGCPSSIKREIGIDRGFKGVTYQQTLEDTNCFLPNIVKIFFIGTFGYFWIFPRNPDKKEINVGIGFFSNFGYNLKELLEKFKKEKRITGKINYVTGGLIPVGLQRPLCYKNIFFVGDAGVGTFPINGQGIFRALISGDQAGKCIAEGCPNKYSHIMNRYFIKWDTLGKTYMRMNYILKNINPKLVLSSLNYFFRFNNRIQL
jgi:flavin-dependent dehydrogenase